MQAAPGLVVAEVLGVQPHPKADRLRVVDVDFGQDMAQVGQRQGKVWVPVQDCAGLGVGMGDQGQGEQGQVAVCALLRRGQRGESCTSMAVRVRADSGPDVTGPNLDQPPIEGCMWCMRPVVWLSLMRLRS